MTRPIQSEQFATKNGALKFRGNRFSRSRRVAINFRLAVDRYSRPCRSIYARNDILISRFSKAALSRPDLISGLDAGSVDYIPSSKRPPANESELDRGFGRRGEQMALPSEYVQTRGYTSTFRQEPRLSSPLCPPSSPLPRLELSGRRRNRVYEFPFAVSPRALRY